MVEVVWLKIPQVSFDESMLSLKLNYLNDTEKSKFNRFKADSRKFEYLLGRIIVKDYISEKFNIKPEEVRFVTNEFGKLFVDYENISSKYPKLFFNISHSKEMVAVAFCHHSSIGIDVENLNPDYINLADSIFTIEEIKLINSFNNIEERVKTFYFLWTRKEALLKALGKGFSISPLTISLPSLLKDYEDNKIKIKTFSPVKNYLLSLVLIKNRKDTINITINEIKYTHLF